MPLLLENWTVTAQPGQDVYSEPVRVLRGRRPDGKCIRTSPIVRVTGNLIQTQTGSEYTLGQPDPRYVEWCREHDHHIPTPEEPIKT